MCCHFAQFDVWYSQIKFTDSSELYPISEFHGHKWKEKNKIWREILPWNFSKPLSHLCLWSWLEFIHNILLSTASRLFSNSSSQMWAGFLCVMIHLLHLLLCPFSFGGIDFLSPYNLTCHYSWLQNWHSLLFALSFMGQILFLNNWNAH